MSRTLKSIRSRAPKASSSFIRFIMQQNKSVNTKPEMLLRRELFKSGLRYRKNYAPEKDLKIKVDIVFTKKRTCIFIDGCFWHGCPDHFKIPKTNSTWWKEKIEDNKIRDIKKSNQLKERGWVVLRFWEHEIPQLNLVVGKIKKLVH